MELFRIDDAGIVRLSEHGHVAGRRGDVVADHRFDARGELAEIDPVTGEFVEM